MRLTLLSVLLGISIQVLAQSHSKVKVWLDPISESLLQERGVELDHGIVKPGVFLINDFDSATIAWMRDAGIRYEVLVQDVKAFYRTREEHSEPGRSGRSACFNSQGDSIGVPSNFTTGSMGGFYTYAEFLAQLDSMHTLYPALISERAPIDTFQSHEGRPIYWVKISDNVDSNEAEPEVLYSAIHHAREPQSLTQLIFYMWYLLENYGSDDEVTMLVDQTEMYFVPMLNPDGYVYNEVNDPNGGGLWRKNRRNNGDGTMGVDLNRNYGYEWGYNNQGSSPNTSSQTYRGPSAFSEPETQAIKWFCEQHSFGLALNYHSYGNYVIYPWGFGTQLTPDSVTFIEMAEAMTAQNGYVFGTGMETVGYTVNGDSDDWMYGEQGTKDKIFAMTPEVGAQTDGFWPAPSRIVPLSQENVQPNLLLAHFAGNYATISDNSPQLIESLQDTVSATATRLGLQFDAPYSFSVESVSSNIASVSAPTVVTAMDVGESVPLSWAITLDNSVSQGEEVVYDLVASFNGYEVRERVTKIFGVPTVLLSNSGNAADFHLGSDWNLTDEDAFSPSHSFTDSPYAPYQNNAYSTITYNRIIDLREADKGLLRFQAKWEIEGGWDYAQILATPIGESAWTPLCATSSVEGNAYQDEGQPIWDGFQSDWTLEEVDLDAYLGERIQIRFQLVSDQYLTYDGFYFDDLEVVALLPDSISTFPDTGYVDTIGTTPPDTSTGMRDVQAQHWTLYPNPAQDQFRILGPEGVPCKVVVTDATGRTMYAGTVQNRQVATHQWPEGIYIVRISDGLGRHLETHRVSVLR